MLQPIAQSMPTFFKDSFAFKAIIDALKVPLQGITFTADAVSMYTNINTMMALSIICPFLRDNERRFGHYHAATLIRALEIVMCNNIVRFGDVYARQISGTAMGKPPAPAWATIFEGIHEITFLPKWDKNLLCYKRFIDDVWAIWLPDANPTTDAQLWKEFQAEVNNNHGLEWEFTERSSSAIFLNLTTTTTTDGSIKTALYEKPMALYLFIPPHSAHPPGVLAGHIFGDILRIFRLNSDEEAIIRATTEFYHRFTRRGHSHATLKPLFHKAIANARKYMATSLAERNKMKEDKKEAARRRLYLHVEYHPQNPPANSIQQQFNETVLQPPGKEALNEMKGSFGHKISIDAMIIANHQAPNLGDTFSYRDISKRKGPPVSSHL